MTQDEMILTLLRAMAKAMVCEKCRGSGYVSDNPPLEYSPVKQYRQNAQGEREEYVLDLPYHKMPTFTLCSCRTAIRDLLKPQGV